MAIEKDTSSFGFEACGKIETVVSYLEMTSEPAASEKPKQRDGVQILRLKEPSVEFYRFLYDQVGEPWSWTARKLMSDQKLFSVISKSTTEIFVLYSSGNPAGYLEIELQDGGEEFEIVYYGLTPQYFRKGLGMYLLNWGLWYVWKEKKTNRIWLRTCTLDGDNALATYLKAGFRKFDESIELVDKLRRVIVPAASRQKDNLSKS